jgi:hypothetical protein
MSSTRRTAVVAGVFFVVAAVAAIASKILWQPVLSDPGYVLGAGVDHRVLLGGLSEFLTAAAVAGTAVALYPVVKRQNESLALGFVASRVLEAAVILVGVVSLLAVVTLRQDVGATAGADTASLVTTGQALVAVRDWTLLLGPGVLAGMNALLLGTLMYRSGLVPRLIPTMGLVGAPILLASCIATLFGLFDQFAPVALILVLPVAAWELSLGLWLTIKGFKPSPITATSVPPVVPPREALPVS